MPILVIIAALFALPVGIIMWCACGLPTGVVSYFTAAIVVLAIMVPWKPRKLK